MKNSVRVEGIIKYVIKREGRPPAFDVRNEIVSVDPPIQAINDFRVIVPKAVIGKFRVGDFIRVRGILSNENWRPGKTGFDSMVIVAREVEYAVR